MKAALLLLGALFSQAGEKIVSINLPAGVTALSPAGAAAAKLPVLPSMPGAQAFALPQTAVLSVPKAAAAMPKAVAPQAAASAPGPKAQTTLAALGRVEAKISASIRGGTAGSANFNWFDGAKDGEEAGEEAFIRKEEKKAEEKKQAHAERPVLDYLRNRLNDDEALELAKEELEFAGGAKMTVLRLLELIVTAHAARTDNPPDLTRADAALFGVSDTDLREIAEREGLPAFALQNFYEMAFRRGLIYRLSDNARGRTYYGVPDPVRALLKLQAPRPPEEIAREKARASAFAQGLPDFADAALELPEGEELFEFSAQVAEAAVKAKLVDRADLPAMFWDRAEELGFEPSPLKDALLTLLESSEGTPWFERSLALCEQAAADGLLARAELDEVLRGLR
jgi:hypothetical protein